MNLIEKTVNKDYIYKGRIINVRSDTALLPNGATALREVVEHPGGVCVAALNENNEMLFVRQYRYPYSEILLEIPAGKLNPGEDPLECGKRELWEETGATADEFLSLGQLYPSPGYCSEIIHIYFARITGTGTAHPDEDEFVECIKIPLDKAVEMVLNNEIKDGKTQTAILKVDALIKQNKLKL